MSVTLAVAPTSKPIALDDAKEHCKVELADTDSDARLTALIAAATATVETKTGRALMPRTYDLRLDAFPCSADEYVLRVPRPPLVSVTSVAYVDEAGAAQTLAASIYEAVDTGLEIRPGRIVRKPLQSWPSVQSGKVNAVTVRFVAGYSGALNPVPENLKHAMLLLIGQWFDNRSNVVIGTIVADLPKGFDALIADYVMPGF